MTFDLAVWNSERALDTAGADAVYQTLCRGGSAPEDVVSPSPRIAAFMAALAARFPDLDSLPDDAVDDSPWSSGFDYSDRHALFNIRWSRADEMFAELRELAADHQLVLYDPQEVAVYHPPHLAPRPRWQFWRR